MLANGVNLALVDAELRPGPCYLEQLPGTVGRLGSLVQPVEGALVVDLDEGRFLAGVVASDLFDVLAVAGLA